jgi:hypothetical protein
MLSLLLNGSTKKNMAKDMGVWCGEGTGAIYAMAVTEMCQPIILKSTVAWWFLFLCLTLTCGLALFS